MFHFYTPRKRQKIEGFSDVFRGVWKCDIGLEWVKKPLTKKCVKHFCLISSPYVRITKAQKLRSYRNQPNLLRFSQRCVYKYSISFLFNPFCLTFGFLTFSGGIEMEPWAELV